MQVIIAGSRDIQAPYTEVVKAVHRSGFDISTVISGTARGVDHAGEIYATENAIPIKRFPADWDTYGKQAGYLRNTQMAENADALIAVWDGRSTGTKHMIDIATKLGLKVYVHNV